MGFMYIDGDGNVAEKSFEDVDREIRERRAAVIAGKTTWGKWSFDPKWFALNSSCGYQVDLLKAGNDRASFVEWLGHVSAKSRRFTSGDIGDLVSAVLEIDGEYEGHNTITRPLFRVLNPKKVLYDLPPPLTDAELSRPGVYAMVAGQYVKIGKATNILQRRRELQTGNAERLECLAILSENPNHESSWHNRFSHLRKDREWFHFGEQVAVWVRDKRSNLYWT